MIRKERKACWVYECQTCRVLATGPDQWSVYEFQWHHVRSISHTAKAISHAFQPVADAMRELGLAWSLPASYPDVLAAAIVNPNRPLDPIMLRDRRKWGGR